MNNNVLDNNAQMVDSKPTPASAPKQEQPNSAKDAIKAYLDERAGKDPLFAVTYAKPNKNIDECFNYILGEARKRGSSVCMTDEEVYGLAVHYYDETDLVVPKSAPRANVSGPAAPKVELTEQEKEEARREARIKYESEYMRILVYEEAERRKKEAERRKAAAKARNFSPSLFGSDEI